MYSVKSAIVEDYSTKSVLRKFKLMKNTSKKNTEVISKIQKSQFSSKEIKDFINSTKDSNKPINIAESLGKNLSGLDLSSIYFSNTIMCRVDFLGSNLDDCVFADSFLEGHNFSNASLKVFVYVDANIIRSNFTKSNLENSILRKTYAKNYRFITVNFENANIFLANFLNSHFNNCNLTRSKINFNLFEDAKSIVWDLNFFSSSQFNRINIVNNSLKVIDWDNAEFTKVGFQASTLFLLNFQNAKLSGTIFNKINAKAVNFSKAKL